MAFLDVLRAEQEIVLRDASDALSRARLTHYEASGPEESRERLAQLCDLVIECVSTRTLGPITRFSETIAADRFAAGFDIAEVQTAFNVLEEAIWHVVVVQLAPDELAEATGMLGTVLGAGKDTMARTWVSLATNRDVPSFDVNLLFQGTES